MDHASGAGATVVVSQVLVGCSGVTDAVADDGTTATPSTGSTSCVQTAALTEGPYFVDEKLERSDIRADRVTGLVSADVIDLGVRIG